MIKAQGKPDTLLLVIVIILVLFGIMMVFSASYYTTISTDDGPYHYLILSAQWALAGFGVMIITIFLPYRLYYYLAPALMVVSLIFLILLFTPLGQEINNARRWLPFGTLTFMPGEFAKIAIIIGCAWYYTKYIDRIKTFSHGFLIMALIAILYFYLIYKQPNLSTAVIVVVTIVAIMFIAGVNIVYLFGALVASGIGVYYMISVQQGEHLSRISGYWDPFADAQGEFFQTVQGLLALGSGGLTGVGLGNSVEKALWLPFAQNDFIFAIIGEETGFIGCILVLIAFVILIWRCLLIAMRSRDRFALLLAGGVGILFAIQVALNIGVVTAVLPPTGVILPFISYGGNAIIMFMFMIGIVLNISRGDGIVMRQGRSREEAA